MGLIFKTSNYPSVFVHVCEYHCVQLLYTIQHRTVLIVVSLILQTIIIAQMMSTELQKDICSNEENSCNTTNTVGWLVGIQRSFSAQIRSYQRRNQQCKIIRVSSVYVYKYMHQTRL